MEWNVQGVLSALRNRVEQTDLRKSVHKIGHITVAFFSQNGKN